MEYHEDRREKEEQPVESEERYSFMQETIKDEHGGRKTRNLILKYAGLGLVFGFAASLGFCALKPWAEIKFSGNPEQVTIPEEEEEEVPEDDAEEVQTPVFTINSYRELNRQLVDVATEAERCVVEIDGVSEGGEQMTEVYDSGSSVSGLIVADNGQELLIFAKSSVAKDAQGFRAVFTDGKSYDAQLKARDENLGFAIFGVKRSDIQDATWNQIKVATLGSSSSMSKGEMVIALGNPFAYPDGMGFGIVASSKNAVLRVDGEYKILCTDIGASHRGTGVLVNIHGEVVGMIDQTISDSDSMNLVTAYGISDLKRMIELLSNGKDVPYLGITGITVTESIAEEQGIPQGIYVQDVRADSPAMAAGIQRGDIITSFDREAVTVLSGYHSQLMKSKVGDEVKIGGQRQGNGGYVDIEFTVTIGSKK